MPSSLQRAHALDTLTRAPRVCTHHLFEARAALAPGAAAVSQAGREVSYGELERRANAVAVRLRALGVGPDVRVAVLMERGPELAAALLGVLKAGGAYVPIDPAYPADRIAYVVGDSGATAVLTDAASRARVPHTGVPVLDVAEIRASEANGFAAADVPEEALAYVIYTSGSTGRPKGVGVTHRSLTAHNRAAAALYALTPRDRVAQVASISFDISVEAIFPTWAVGATVVFRPPEARALGEDFLRWIEAERITVLNLPTAFWHVWTRELVASGARVPRCVRLAVVGGEKAQRSTFDDWRRVADESVRWINTYGPTETTVTATAWEPGAREDAGEIPIGVPLDGWTARVLDGALAAAPAGAEGELCIGGAGVARGYLGRPGFTAERFVPDPFALEPGARMFRSGDRARVRADGALEFLGRLDDQVKVRGFRVEPGEIEAALAEHPDLVDAIVTVREDAPGDKRLVAYVVLRGENVSPTALRQWLQNRLPDYMVPSAFVPLDTLPLTPNGKVERRALPAPSSAPAGPLPRTRDTVDVIAEIWREVLGVAHVGPDDDFFDLGGHSLVAVQVLGRVRRLCGVDLPWRVLFNTPTPAALAAAVDSARGVDATRAQPPPPSSRADELPGGPSPQPASLNPDALRDALFNRVAGYLRDSISRLDDRGLLDAVEAPTPAGTIARVLSAAPDAGLEQDPWTEALLRGAAIKHEVLRLAGGLLSSGEVAALLGISVAAVKQRQRRKNLLAVPLANGEWGYPARQFAESGKVHEGLPRVLAALAGTSPWVVLSFLVNPVPGSNEGIAFDRLSDPETAETLVEVARTYGEQGAA